MDGLEGRLTIVAAVGRLVAIHVAPEPGAPVNRVDEVIAEAGAGLVGDRYHGSRHRHVTVIAREDVEAAGAELGIDIPAGATRRNLTVDGVAVPTRPGARLWIGEAALEVVRRAAPCRQMETAVGPGGMRALHDRGGAVCRLLAGGVLRPGDPVEVATAAQVVVHGRVQGVFFRASTRDRADDLGVSGWVRNRPDGTVEAHLEGRPSSVTTLLDWMEAGGPGGHARVDDVVVRPVEVVGHTTFEVTR